VVTARPARQPLAGRPLRPRNGRGQRCPVVAVRIRCRRGVV